MAEELKYLVIPQEIGDLIARLRSNRLIISPYFQRNLVWRDAHKHDFIDTVLCGYPFPQIFLARGKVDLEKMVSYSCVVDGQQRMNAIREYISDEFPVNGKLFSELSDDEKTAFIKYKVPVIDLDMDAGDPRLKDVFKRLNRTFYSLSIIERIATEYSASEFLLTARVLCGDISTPAEVVEEVEAAVDILDDAQDGKGVDLNEFYRDPGISPEKWQWLQERAGGKFSLLLSEKNVFSPYEFQRKTPLMFVLNVMCTMLGGYYSRNAKVKDYLEDYSDAFYDSDIVISKFNQVAEKIKSFNLNEKSIWWTKSNFFTMAALLCRHHDLDLINSAETGEAMNRFADAPPREFSDAAREAVNNRPERLIRANAMGALLAPQEAIIQGEQ